jgi:hypothetical protein
VDEEKDKKYISGKSEIKHEVLQNKPSNRGTTLVHSEVRPLESYEEHEAKKVESSSDELLHVGTPFMKRSHSPLKRGNVFVLGLARNRTKSPHNNRRRKYGIDADQAHH